MSASVPRALQNHGKRQDAKSQRVNFVTGIGIVQRQWNDGDIQGLEATHCQDWCDHFEEAVVKMSFDSDRHMVHAGVGNRHVVATKLVGTVDTDEMNDVDADDFPTRTALFLNIIIAGEELWAWKHDQGCVWTCRTCCTC